MRQIKIMMFSKRKIKRGLFLITTSSIVIYLLISIYFNHHFFFQTEINGINVSLKTQEDLPNILRDFIEAYELRLLEQNGDTEVITSQDIGMQYNINAIPQLKHLQNSFLWIRSLFIKNQHYIKGLYEYNSTLLENRSTRLNCFNGRIVEPHNVDFKYDNGAYKIINEIYGNKINKVHFTHALNKYISEGRQRLDLSAMQCYENPKYTVSSKKTLKTLNLLNRYISAKITYRFGAATEQLDGAVLHSWLSIDENLDVTISKKAIAEYVNMLSKKYNTVGILREFQSSTGKKIELQGGLYGWKINSDAEAEVLFNHIRSADVLEKEPIYLQRAFSREGNEIGNTYIEINITKQHLWYYKNGKLLIQGSVVTGNPNRGNATVLGVYMINYKQKEATLTGQGYEAKVTYWMPFFGNMGLHDASWRYRFGGEIYLRNGTHGCVNAPIHLAKTIFENIEAGTPVILYEE